MEEEKKEIKKSNNVLVIVLCLIICLLVAFIAYDKLIVNQKANNKEENEKIKKEEKETEKETELKESDVLDYITTLNDVLVSFGAEGSIKISDISNDKIIDFAFKKAEWRGEKKTAQDIVKVIEDTFGKDFSYQLVDIECFLGDGVIYKYNQAEGTYSRVGEHGHGGIAGNRLKTYFVEGKQTSDTITIKAKVLYGEFCGDVCGPSTYFYSKATHKKDELLYHVEDESHYDDYDFVYNEVKDQLPITTFIFKKQSDGRFALTEIK